MTARRADASSAGAGPVTIRVPFTADSVALARGRLRRWMLAHDFPHDATDDARVIVSELLANAIRHAQPLDDGTLLVTWCRVGAALEIAVTDGGGATSPRAVQAANGALAGRGLAIIETLSARWWAERTPARSTVYAVLAGS